MCTRLDGGCSLLCARWLLAGRRSGTAPHAACYQLQLPGPGLSPTDALPALPDCIAHCALRKLTEVLWLSRCQRALLLLCIILLALGFAALALAPGRRGIGRGTGIVGTPARASRGSRGARDSLLHTHYLNSPHITPVHMVMAWPELGGSARS